MSYVKTLTISLLSIHFVSAAGCRCFDFYDIGFVAIWTSMPKSNHKIRIRYWFLHRIHLSYRFYCLWSISSPRHLEHVGCSHHLTRSSTTTDILLKLSVLAYTADQICRMVEFLIDNIFVNFVGCVFRQVIGIPIRMNCAPLLADLFLYSYESEFLDNMKRGGHRKLARSFNLCY